MNKKSAMRKKHSGGFSMAEVIVAMTLFAASVLGISAMLISGASNINMGGVQNQATALAREKIEEVKSLPFYVPWTGHPTDIDDFYFDWNYPNHEQSDHPGQVEDPVPGHPGYVMKTSVTYQTVMSSGGGLVDAEMSPNWVPSSPLGSEIDRPTGREPGAGEYDELHGVLIEVTVVYTTDKGCREYKQQALSGDFTNDPPMVITSIAPTYGYSSSGGYLDMSIYVDAIGLTPGQSQVEVIMWYPGTSDVDATGESVTSETRIECTFDLTDPGVRPGPYNIAVYWEEEGWMAKFRENVFMVDLKKPEITGLATEDSYTPGVHDYFEWGFCKQTARPVKIFGEYLNDPLGVWLVGPSPENDYQVPVSVISSGDDSIEVEANLAAEPSLEEPDRKWSFKVITHGGEDISDGDGERLHLNPTPEITGVSDSGTYEGYYCYDWGYRDLSQRRVRVTGEYLYGLDDSTTTKTLKYSGWETVNGTVPSSSFPSSDLCPKNRAVHIVFNPSSAEADETTNNTMWDVYIANSGGGTCSDCDSERLLMNPPPLIESMSETSLVRGEFHIGVVLKGKYLQVEGDRCQVTMEKDDEEDVVETQEEYKSESKIVLNINLAWEPDGPFEEEDLTEVGDWTLKLLNVNDGQENSFFPVSVCDPE